MGYAPDSLTEFYAACAAASWPEPLWHASRNYFLAHGIPLLSYHHLPPLGAPDEGKIRVIAEGFPEAWVHRYIREKLYRIDPIPAHAMTVEFPFRWTQIGEFRDLNRAEEQFVGALRDAGIGEGLAMPVFGPGGRNGYFGLGFEDISRRPTEPELREFQNVCQTAHLYYCRMLRNSLPDPPSLSPREVEILQWVARGKSNGVIADIMELSPHTVDAYLRRIFLKLGTTDRISAAIRGLGTGLIRGY